MVSYEASPSELVCVIWAFSASLEQEIPHKASQHLLARQASEDSEQQPEVWQQVALSAEQVHHAHRDAQQVHHAHHGHKSEVIEISMGHLDAERIEEAMQATQGSR